MKPAEKAQIEFIKDCLRNGQERKDILPKFTEIYHKSEKTFNTRLKAATIAIQSETDTIKDKSDEYIAKEISERNLKILTVAERKDILSKMAIGELVSQQIVIIQGSPDLMEVKPSHADRRAAIAELNKMGGDYSPMKTELTLTNYPQIIIPGEETDDN